MEGSVGVKKKNIKKKGKLSRGRKIVPIHCEKVSTKRMLMAESLGLRPDVYFDRGIVGIHRSNLI